MKSFQLATLGILFIALATAGCATPLGQKTWAWMQSGDPEDDNEPGFNDPWAGAASDSKGKRLRGDKLEGNDPAYGLFRSPKAAAIENNLGIR